MVILFKVYSFLWSGGNVIVSCTKNT